MVQVHVFDVDIPSKNTFTESDVFSPGNKLLAFDTGQLFLLCMNSKNHYFISCMACVCQLIDECMVAS